MVGAEKVRSCVGGAALVFFGGGGLLCRCVSLEHARGTIGVLIWQIERCSQGWVWVREWHVGSHPWNEKNKLNFFILRIAPPSPPFPPHTRFLDWICASRTILGVILWGREGCRGKIRSDKVRFYAHLTKKKAYLYRRRALTLNQPVGLHTLKIKSIAFQIQLLNYDDEKQHRCTDTSFNGNTSCKKNNNRISTMIHSNYISTFTAACYPCGFDAVKSSSFKKCSSGHKSPICDFEHPHSAF